MSGRAVVGGKEDDGDAAAEGRGSSEGLAGARRHSGEEADGECGTKAWAARTATTSSSITKGAPAALARGAADDAAMAALEAGAMVIERGATGPCLLGGELGEMLCLVRVVDAGGRSGASLPGRGGCGLGRGADRLNNANNKTR